MTQKPKPKKVEWYLFGVKVTEEEFKMDANEVDVRKCIIEEKNAQRRMAFMMKVGSELLYKKLGGKVIDEETDMYKVIEIDLGEAGICPYLYMKNPSVGVFHMEGVTKGTKTVVEALRSRMPKRARELPIDDVNGADWYQQGDTVHWPKDAKSLKSRPKILT